MNKPVAKPRIALFAMGIFGDRAGRGIPVLTDLFTQLSQHFDIVFYSFGHHGLVSSPQSIKFRTLISWPIPGRIRYALLCLQFLFDHVRSRFDVLFAVSVFPTGLWAVRMGRLVNRKVIVQAISLEMASIPDIGAGSLFDPWHRKISTRVCKKADALVAVAEYQKKIAIRSMSMDREIVVLPLRIDPKKFPFHERKVSFPVSFIHVAFYSPVKDQHTMFRAFARVAQKIKCHLTVIGRGYEVLSVHQLLDRLGIREKVTFVGDVDQGLIPIYLRQAHILVHPARFETGCAVVQEAMASGVAVCGTQVGILDDLGDRYASIVPPQNPSLLAEKMLELVNDPQLYQRLIREAHKWITQYDARWSTTNYQHLIEGLLHS